MDEVAIVTGATGGIGLEIARGLTQRGMHVVLAARSRESGTAAAAQIATGNGHGSLSVLPLDVADQSSIRSFAAGIRERFPGVAVLVNNAGAWFTDRRDSPDGIELTLATNVIGPHLLADLLLDPLRAANGRVVNVVSSIQGNYDAEDLQFTRRPYDGYRAYGQSKQALSMLTWGLAARLARTGVTANTVSPGFVRTGFNRHAHGPRATMINLSVRLFAVSPAKGADTPVWVATAPELAGVTGKHYEGRKEKAARWTEQAAIEDLEQRVRQLEQVS